MGIEGNLKTMCLRDLLSWAGRSRTGALLFTRGETEKRLYFVEGKVVASSSSEPAEFLSALILRRELLEPECVEEVLTTLDGSDELLGRYLVNNGRLTSQQLSEVLLDKTKQTAMDLFSWYEGDFRFIDEELLAPRLSDFELTTDDLIEDGRERMECAERLGKIFPNGEVIPVAIGFLDDPEFSSEHREVLRQVDDNRSLDEICSLTSLDTFSVSKALMAAIEKGRLKVVQPRPGNNVSSKAPSGALSTGITMLDSESLLEVAGRILGEGDYLRAVKYIRAARSLEPENQAVAASADELEQRVCSMVEESGITSDAVPSLSRPIEELARLGLPSRSSLLLTRVDGRSPVGEIVKLVPMRPLEARLALLELVSEGHLTV